MQEVLEENKWEQLHNWAIREEEQQFRFSVEKRATLELILQVYITENVSFPSLVSRSV